MYHQSSPSGRTPLDVHVAVIVSHPTVTLGDIFADRTIGLVRRTLEATTTLLRGMHVDPAYQRRGVGDRLLRALVADLVDVECFCIPFAHLTSFYGRAAFAVIQENVAPAFLVQWLHRYQADGHDVLIMRRPPSVRHLDRAG